MEEKSKVYVGNLDYNVTEDDLKALFEEKGLETKDVAIIKDKYSGRSKGFGFVELESEEAIQKAIESLDQADLKGRKVRVSKAKKQRDKF